MVEETVEAHVEPIYGCRKGKQMSEEQAQYDMPMVTLSAYEYKAELRLAYLQGFKAAVEATQYAYEKVQKTITRINKTGGEMELYEQ